MAAFAGFAAILLLTPMQMFFSRLFGQYRRYTVQRTDMRVKTINEILIGADVMKMMGWERSLEAKVNSVRREEFESISRAARLKSINQAAFFASMSIVNLVTFATMWGRGVTFTPADVFGAITLFNVIKFPLSVTHTHTRQRHGEQCVARGEVWRFICLTLFSSFSLSDATCQTHTHTDRRRPSPGR